MNVSEWGILSILFILRSNSRSSHQKQRDPYTNTEIGSMPKHKAEAPFIVIMGYIDHTERLENCTETRFNLGNTCFNLLKRADPIFSWQVVNQPIAAVYDTPA